MLIILLNFINFERVNDHIYGECCSKYGYCSINGQYCGSKYHSEFGYSNVINTTTAIKNKTSSTKKILY